MTSPATLLPLVLLVASSSVGILFSVAHADNGGLKHLHMYMHELTEGENATALMAVTNGVRANTTFGMVTLLDNELRDGPDRSNSTLIGRFQGIVAYLGLVTPPGKETVISFVFTAGKHSGSTLAVIGSLIPINGTYERAIVGGTGKFRMARGYSLATILSITPTYNRYEVNLFLKMDL